MGKLYWRFLIATAIGITPGIVMNSLAAENDAPIGAGLALLVAPPFVNFIAGYTRRPRDARQDDHTSLSVFLGSLSIALPTFLVLNAPSGAGAATMLLTAIVVGLSLAGAGLGLAARSER